MTRRTSASIDQSPLRGPDRELWQRSLLASAENKGQKHLLRVLFDYAQGKADCHPSKERLAADAACDPKTIYRTLKRLGEIGLVASVDDGSIRVGRRLVFPSHPNAAAVLAQFPGYVQGGQDAPGASRCTKGIVSRCTKGIVSRCTKGIVSRCTKGIVSRCTKGMMPSESSMENPQVRKKRNTLKPPPRSATPAPRVRARGGPGGGEVAISIVSCRVIGCPGGEACAVATDVAEWHERVRRFEKGGCIGLRPLWTSHRPAPAEVEEYLEEQPPRPSGPACDGAPPCMATTCPDCWDLVWGEVPDDLDGDEPEIPIQLWQWVEEVVEWLGESRRVEVVQVARFGEADEATLWKALEWLKTRPRKPKDIRSLDRLRRRLGRR